MGRSSFKRPVRLVILLGFLLAITAVAFMGKLAYDSVNELSQNLQEAQRGIAFAGYLKLLLPLIVVIPGIVAYAMFQEDPTLGGITKADEAYPWLLGEFVGPGFRGLAFAALIAAVVSSLASMMNSTSTIFTMDIYKEYINKEATENRLVTVGRITGLIALVIACLVTPALNGLDQMFQYIQEFSGFVTPAVAVIFLFGMFWIKATPTAALWVAILSIPLNLIFFYGLPDVPFIDRMGFIFVILCYAMVLISMAGKYDFKFKDQRFLMIIATMFLFIIVVAGDHEMFHDTILDIDNAFGKFSIHMMSLLFLALALFMTKDIDYDDNAIEIPKKHYKSTKTFNIAAIVVTVMVALIYIIWW